MPQHLNKKIGLLRIADTLTVALAAFAVGYTNVLLFAGFFDIPTGTYEATASFGRIPILPGLLDALSRRVGSIHGIHVTMSGYAYLPVMLLFLTILFAAVSLLPKPGWWYVGLSFTEIGWIVWQRAYLIQEFSDLLWYITRIGTVRRLLSAVIPGLRSPSSRGTETVRDALLLCGLLLAILTMFLLMRRRNSLWFSALNVIAAASLCVFLQTDPPRLPFLFLIAAHIVLILVSLMRGRDPASARRILFYFMIPSTVFCLLCGMIGEQFTRPAWADTAVRQILDFANERIRGSGSGNGNSRTVTNAVTDVLGTYVWNSNPTISYLSLAGPHADSDVPAMEIFSDTTRTYYLRGMSYGWYDGTRWIVWDEMPGVRADSLTTDASPDEQLLVRTAKPTGVLYLPYTPTELPQKSFAYSDQYVRTERKVGEYTVLFKPNAYFAPVSSAYYNALRPAYTYVLDSTAEELADIVSLFDPEDPNVVFEVANYVRNAATYDLDTDFMPPGRDFVSWFLHDSDTGYCVHFASAATVLLRLLDIPARYVTGYRAEAIGGQWTTVTQGDAHAWVEYFDESNASWRMLEVTSSVEIAEEEEEVVSTPTAPLPNLRGDDAESPSAGREERTEPAPVQQRRRSPMILAILLPVLAAAVAWPFAMKAIRRADLTRGDRNRQVLARYRYAAWLAASLGRDVSAPVREAALRTRFSQHPATEEDLALVRTEADALTAERRKTTNPFRWVWVRYFLAI